MAEESSSSGAGEAIGALGVASLAAPVAGTILSGLFGNYQTKKRNKAQREMLEYQNQWNLEQWNRENAYNHPSAQMERLRAAGLNPNLVYQSGAANTSASSPRSGSMDVSQVPSLDFAGTLNDSIGNYMAFRQLQMQQQSNDARISLMRSQAQAVQQDALNKSLEYVNKNLRNSILKSTLPYQVGTVKESYNRLLLGNELLGQQKELNVQALDLRERRMVLQEYLGNLQYARLQLDRQRFDLGEKEYERRKYEMNRKIGQAEAALKMKQVDWQQLQKTGGSYFKNALNVIKVLSGYYKP